MARVGDIIRDFQGARESLIRNDLTGEAGFRTAQQYADLMDRFIRVLFFEAGLRERLRDVRKEGLAVVALGGYGRRELCFFSDVDLMVIHQGRLSPEMREIISQALYPLWDAKLEVAHSILTIPEAIRLSVNDFRVLTSLLDVRFLLGSRSVYRRFEAAFRSRIHRERDSLRNQFLLYQKRREERYLREACFIEPDIKEGLGGLRDLHYMAWVARIYFGCDRLSQVRQFPVFSHFDLDRLNQSKGFLLKVRNRLHALLGRKEDRLLLPYQKDLSEIPGFYKGSPRGGPQEFMRLLYFHLNRMRYGHEEFQTKAFEIIAPSPSRSAPDRLPSDFDVVRDHIVLKGGRTFEEDPLVILRALREANERGLSLGAEFIWESKKRIVAQRKRIVSSLEAIGLFLEIILNPKNPKLIRLALEIGLIDLFIPEFKRIRNLPEFDYYHVETVDLHSLRTLEVIHDISTGTYDTGWPMFREIYQDLEHPEWLFLAGLLHDIGKGRIRNHERKGSRLIPGILRRLKIGGKALEVIPDLVNHHLLLVRISQSRDLSDEKTSVQVAQLIQDEGLLKMLFLLSVADSFATGPMARTEWKIMLLIELFFKVRHILESGTLASPDATSRIEINKRYILDRLGTEHWRVDILGLIEQVPSRYFLNMPLEDMVTHFGLALTMEEKRFSWHLKRFTDASVTRVILCTYDKPGLFTKMVGIFTLNNIHVLSAQIFTLKNGLAFDVYEVTNPPDPLRQDEQWEKIRREIDLTIEERLPVDALIEKKVSKVFGTGKYQRPQAKEVRIDNEASDFFSVIEINSGIGPGQLYTLAKKIFSLGLDIRFARINSGAEVMMGVFYVMDSEGQKIHEQDRIDEIRQGMLDVVD